MPQSITSLNRFHREILQVNDHWNCCFKLTKQHNTCIRKHIMKLEINSFGLNITPYIVIWIAIYTMKNNKYRTVRGVPKCYSEIIETEVKSIPIHLHHRPLAWLDTWPLTLSACSDGLIFVCLFVWLMQKTKSGGFKLSLWVRN